jgi:3-oxoacyl-[acyl-carrier-protein] synthase-3
VKQFFIRGIGHAHPSNVITNQFLTELNIGTTDEWILDRVGISERRTILPLEHILLTKNRDRNENLKYIHEAAGTLVEEAVNLALKRAGMSRDDVDLVIAGGCTPTNLIPSDSATYAHRLGISKPCIDFNAACSSFTAGVHFARNLFDYRNILLINCEVPTTHVDYSDRKNCVLIGDACAATILSQDEGIFTIENTLFKSNPSGCDKVVLPIDGFFQQDGPAVQKFAISHMVSIYNQMNEALQPSSFIGHQANLKALESVIQRATIKKHYHNIELYGNTFAAGAPSVISQNYDKFEVGESIVVATVGSGLSWGGMRIRKNS